MQSNKWTGMLRSTNAFQPWPTCDQWLELRWIGSKLNRTLRQNCYSPCNCCPCSRSRCSVCFCVTCTPWLPTGNQVSRCCMYSAHLRLQPAMLHFSRQECYVPIFILSRYTICRILHRNIACSLFHRVAPSLAPANGVDIYASLLLVKELVN